MKQTIFSLALILVGTMALQAETGYKVSARYPIDGTEVMVVMDAATGRVITHLPIGAGVDYACFDPASRLIFFSCGAAVSISVFHEECLAYWWSRIAGLEVTGLEITT